MLMASLEKPCICEREEKNRVLPGTTCSLWLRSRRTKQFLLRPRAIPTPRATVCLKTKSKKPCEAVYRRITRRRRHGSPPCGKRNQIALGSGKRELPRIKPMRGRVFVESLPRKRKKPAIPNRDEGTTS